GGFLPAGRRLFYVPFLVSNLVQDPKTNSVGLAFEESFGVNGGHAARSGGGDCLAVDVILYIAASEDPRHIGLRTILRQDVNRGISIQLSDEQFGIGFMTDGNKKTVGLEILSAPGL